MRPAMYLHGKYLTASALARTQHNYECVALSPNQRSRVTVIDIDSEALGVQYTEPRLTERVANIEREPFSFNASSNEAYIKEAVRFLNDFVWSSDRPREFSQVVPNSTSRDMHLLFISRCKS